MKKNNKKGFTLAELLIVVAIIGVLVAVSIPIFTSQLHKAKDATDLANIRSKFAELQTSAITDGVKDSELGNGKTTIKLEDGEQITLNNLTYDVAKNANGDGYVVTWKCEKSGHSGDATGSFGGTAGS